MKYLKKLNGFQRSPAGLEWKIWKMLHVILAVGTALPLLASAGAYVLDRHVRLGAGVHCLQIEIDRRAYLDAQMSEPGPGFTGTASLLAGLVQRIAALVGEMGQVHQRWPAAAE